MGAPLLNRALLPRVGGRDIPNVAEISLTIELNRVILKRPLKFTGFVLLLSYSRI